MGERSGWKAFLIRGIREIRGSHFGVQAHFAAATLAPPILWIVA